MSVHPEATAETVRPELAGRLGRIAGFVGRSAVRISAVGLFGVGALHTFGTVEGHVGPATMEASLQVGLSGEVRTNVSVGENVFDPSDGPLGLDIRMTNLDSGEFTAAKEKLDSQSGQNIDVLHTYEPEITALGKRAVVVGGLSLLGGGLLGIITAEGGLTLAQILRKKQIPNNKKLMQATSLALLWPVGMLGAAGGMTRTTYDETAVYHSRVEGSLKDILGFAEQATSSLKTYKRNSAQLTSWFNNMLTIRQNLATLPELPSHLIPVVAIADRHSRPCSYERLETLVKDTHAAFVLNLGDEDEWGQNFENPLFSSAACPDDNPGLLGSTPMVFVGGNHDGPETKKRMEQYPNVHLPDATGGRLELTVPYGAAGPQDDVTFEIVGQSDPRFTPDFAGRDPLPEEQKALQETADTLLANIASHDKQPDLILMHDPTVRKYMAERGPLPAGWAFAGHLHKFKVNQKERLIDFGSFGGAGLRSHEHAPSDERSTMQAAIVYMNPATKQPVYLVDLRLQNDGTFSGTTHYFDDPLLPESLRNSQPTTTNP